MARISKQAARAALDAQAPRQRARWTQRDLQTIARTDLTAAEMAAALGRTYGEVIYRRQKLSPTPRSAAARMRGAHPIALNAALRIAGNNPSKVLAQPDGSVLVTR